MTAKLLALVMLLGIAGCGRSNLNKAGEQILELVPFGTPLPAARQIMEQHQFTCSVVSYTNPAQISTKAEQDLWNTPILRGGRQFAVTNLSILKCTKTNSSVTFTVINGETTGLAVRGKL